MRYITHSYPLFCRSLNKHWTSKGDMKYKLYMYLLLDKFPVDQVLEKMLLTKNRKKGGAAFNLWLCGWIIFVFHITFRFRPSWKIIHSYTCPTNTKLELVSTQKSWRVLEGCMCNFFFKCTLWVQNRLYNFNPL